MSETVSTQPGEPGVEQDPTTPVGVRPRLSPAAAFRRLARGELGSLRIVIGIALVWVIFQVQNDNFLTAGNLTNLLLQVTAVALISVGIVLVLLLGEIDLSVGSVSGVTAAIVAVLSVKNGWSPVLAIAAGIAAGLAIGLFQGVMITIFQLPSFVVTLAGLIGWQGLQLKVLGTTGSVPITKGPIPDLAHTFYADWVGWVVGIGGAVVYGAAGLAARRRRARAGLALEDPVVFWGRFALVTAALVATVWVLNSARGMPLPVLILVGFTALFAFIATRTQYGRQIYATGGNAEAARRAGIKINRIRISVFMLASMMSAVGGIMAASRLYNVNQSSGSSDLLLLAIAGPVVAGVSLFGGRGTVWAALLGAILIGSISNGMDLIGLSSPVKFMITGGVLLAAVTLDSATRLRRQAVRRT